MTESPIEDPSPRGDVPRGTPPAATALFGPRAPLAERYAWWLATAGVQRGLLGPREEPRLWERHILNSAVVAELLKAGDTVVDVGSGAGLPGIPLAVARCDVRVTLAEPLLRRSDFLREVIADLGLENCKVVRARAEELPQEAWSVATARAVAPLSRLAALLLPRVAVGGRMLAMKGSSVDDEIAEAGGTLRRLGASVAVKKYVGGTDGLPRATVVEVVRVQGAETKRSRL